MASESWVTTAKQRNRLTSAEMRFLGKFKGKIKRENKKQKIQEITEHWIYRRDNRRKSDKLEKIDEKRLVKKVYVAKENSEKKKEYTKWERL